jgi:formylglycine-generating enzyme required for sulfatase activity
MRKLFISYRSSDALKVDKIAKDLGLLLDGNGNPRFKTWQDKHSLPPGSPNWWDAIVDAIIDCDAFVFNLSKASLQSDVCKAELDYAHKRRRPIIVVALEGEYYLNPASGKYDLPKATWDLVPEWLRERQFLFSGGTDFYSQFETAIDLFERNWPRDTKAPRPLNPDKKSIHGTNHAVYDTACDYAERLAFSDAEKHFDILQNDSDYAEVAAEWLELLRLYAELIEIYERRNTRFMFKSRWQAYESLFPKHFLDSIFDPKGLAKQNGLETIPQVVQTAISEAPPSVVAKPSSLDIMPQPFAWIEIPNKGYSIAKYPVTNLQFNQFIYAGGYQERQWWTKDGWEAKQKGWDLDSKSSNSVETNKAWTEPRYWQDSTWNRAEQPVVGISWYEAVAFCLWLSDTTGEKIMLPTEEQWQYAAQGDDGRSYPWGKEWYASRCNNNVDRKGIGKTSPVRQYEGKGDSPFGVVDMAGNVLEWCLTDYENKTNDFSRNASLYVLRGGTWYTFNTKYFLCNYRFGNHPYIRNDLYGFRLCRND